MDELFVPRFRHFGLLGGRFDQHVAERSYIKVGKNRVQRSLFRTAAVELKLGGRTLHLCWHGNLIEQLLWWPVAVIVCLLCKINPACKIC